MSYLDTEHVEYFYPEIHVHVFLTVPSRKRWGRVLSYLIAGYARKNWEDMRLRRIWKTEKTARIVSDSGVSKNNGGGDRHLQVQFLFKSQFDIPGGVVRSGLPTALKRRLTWSP